VSFLEFIQDNILTVAIALISGFMLVWPGFRTGGKRVNTHQAIQLINHENAIIIDVREAAEFAGHHLPEARNFPFKELESRMAELEPLKEKNLLLVCASGARSGQVSARLEKQGFTQVNCLEGGLDAWQRAGLPLIRSRKK
jgi:rhodanese-related sulfurtransferase